MPFLKRLVEGQIGSVTFAEIADGLASIDVSKGDPEWREVWAELIETVRSWDTVRVPEARMPCELATAIDSRPVENEP